MDDDDDWWLMGWWFDGLWSMIDVWWLMRIDEIVLCELPVVALDFLEETDMDDFEGGDLYFEVDRELSDCPPV